MFWVAPVYSLHLPTRQTYGISLSCVDCYDIIYMPVTLTSSFVSLFHSFQMHLIIYCNNHQHGIFLND